MFKSEALKEIVKDLEQVIFGDDDNDEAEGLDKDLLEAEELDRRFKNLISKKRCESLREYLKESEDANPQGRVNALKEYLKKAKYTDLQIKVNALKKKLNNLPKTSSDDNNNNNDNDDSDDNNNNNDNDDSEDNNNNNNNDNDDSEENNNNDNDDSVDNQISNFVDEVLKKVRKEIVNDDDKKVSKEIVNDDAKKKSNQKSKENITEQIKKMEASENLFNKQFRDAKEILELSKKYKESSAKTDKIIKKLSAEIKDREEVSKNTDKAIKEYYTKEAQRASKEIEKYKKMINDNLDMSSEKSEIINKLIELHSLIQIYYLNKIDNNLKANENINNISIERDIIKLEKRLRELSKKGRGMFTSQKEFAKLLNFFSTITY